MRRTISTGGAPRARSAAAMAVAVAMGLAACSGAGDGGNPPAARGTISSAEARLADAFDRGDDRGLLEARAERGLAISPVPLDLSRASPRDRTLVGLGSYIVNAASDCAGCHSSAAGFLAGGNPFFLDAHGHVVWSRNLTPDPATGLTLTLAQFKESLRTGRDFHPGATRQLVVMPWPTLRWTSDLDLEAIYAYLRAIPAAANAVPPDAKSDLPLPAAVPFPDRYTDGNVVRPLRGDRRSFDARRGLSISPLATPAGIEGERAEAFGIGSYVANALTGCTECHTSPDRTPDFAKINTAAFLTGGSVYGVPPPLQPVLHQVRATSANLEGAVHGFFSEPDDSYQRFHDLIHAGAHVDEVPPRPLGFPMILIAGYLSNLLDDDLRAVYAYVKEIPRTVGPTDVPRQPPARWCAAAADCAAGETCAATGECVGGACAADEDCGTCQTCEAGTCRAPAPDSACVASAR